MQPATLQQALYQLTVPELQDIASALGTRPPTRKADLVSTICASMQGANLKKSWASLGPDQQQAIAEAVHSPEAGQFNWIKIRSKYGAWAKPMARGTFRFFSPDVRYIPGDVVAALKAFVKEPAADVIQYEPSVETSLPPDAVLFSGEMVAPLEFKTVLRLIEEGKVSVSAKTGRASAATQRIIKDLLVGGDFYPAEWTPSQYVDPIGTMRAFSWPILIQAGGFAQLSGSKLALTKAGQQALLAPASKSLKALFTRWLKSGILDEFTRIDNIKGQTSGGGRHMTNLAKRRSVIQPGLSSLQPGRWVSPDEWMRHMVASDQDFAVTTDPWRLYISDSQYGTLGGDGPWLWNVLNKRYLLALLYESLATMGIVDLAYVTPDQGPQDFRDLWGTDDLYYLSRYDGLLYFRLNALGAYVLGQTAEYVSTSPSPKSRLTYGGDGIIVDHDNTLLPADRLYLERLTKQTDSPAQWQLSMDTLAKAVESGTPVTQIRTFLESLLGTIPDEVDFILSDLHAGADRITSLGQGVILQTRDAVLAQKLASDPRLSQWVLQADGNHLVVLPGKEAAVRRRLNKMGFVLPRDML